MTMTNPISAGPQWQSRYILVGQVRLHYLEGGDGPTVLCLHGTSMTAHCWGDLAERLSDSFRVVALDMRGHGRSGRPASSYTIGELAGDVAAFIDAAGLAPLTIVGSSVGTQVAVAVAARRSELVSGLILSDPSFSVSDGEILKYLRSHHFRPRHFATRHEAEAFCRALPQRAGLTPRLHELAMQGDFREEQDGSWGWAYDLAAITKVFLNLSIDQSDEIGGVQAPVLILNAERSNVLGSAEAERLAAAFHSARLVRIGDSNHTIWGDQPERLAQETRAFLER